MTIPRRNRRAIIGDVGQSGWEEIDYEPPNLGGRNYGWRNREGAHPNIASPPLAHTLLVDPIHEYDRTLGQAVTGGYVYRGLALGFSHRDRYFYADFVQSRVWSLRIAVDSVCGPACAIDVREHTVELGGTAMLGNVSSFGLDADGELYIVNYGLGRVLKVLPDALAITTAPAGDFDGDAEADITVQLAAWMRDADEVREVPFWCARVPLRWRYSFDGGTLYSKRSPGSGGVLAGICWRRLTRS